MTDRFGNKSKKDGAEGAEEQESEESLKRKNQELRDLLKKVIRLLKEKTTVCQNLEKQNNALNLQITSLKDIVSITKNLLGIRNTEVDNMQRDLDALQQKIGEERDRHDKMVESIDNANKLNEDIRGEYKNQMDLFQELRDRYNEKSAALLLENEKLKLELQNLKNSQLQ